MKLLTSKNQYKLNAESVDLVSEDINRFLTQLKAPRKNRTAARLSVEELLLSFMDKFGEEKEFTYIKSKFLGKPYITLSLKGEAFNPLEKEGDDEFGNWATGLIQNADYTPSYSYDNGVNSVTMRFSKKQVNPIVSLAAAIVIALLLSMLQFAIPAEGILFIKESVLTPFYEAFIGLMTTVEIPLMFLSIACGIIGIGDSTVFGRIGRKMVLRFLAVILLFTSLSGIVFSFLFTNFKHSSEAGVSIKYGINLLLGLIPHNLVDPIIEGNTLQVMLMAVVLGVSIVILGSKAKTVANIINEGNSIIVYITSLISRLLPVFIVFVLLNMIWDDNTHLFADMWKPIAAFVAVLIVLFVLMAVIVSVREKVNIGILLKKMMPTFLIGLGTASSVAANGECSDSLHRRLGAGKRFVEFGQPVGGVIFMPATAINFIVCAIYMASYYKVDISFLWYIIAVVICSFVAVATPPVPGGAVAAYTIIFSQLGIPLEAVTIVVTLDIIFDFIATAFDGAFLQLELIVQAQKNNMLDFEVLRKP